MNRTTSPYEDLANAIVLQAVKDYRKALAGNKLHPKKKPYRKEKNSIERFFRSRWFSDLSNLDPLLLMRKLREEVK